MNELKEGLKGGRLTVQPAAGLQKSNLEPWKDGRWKREKKSAKGWAQRPPKLENYLG